MFLGTFGTENTYIWILTQDITDLKYVTVLGNTKVSLKGHNSQLSAERMVKVLHKFFKTAGNKLNHSLPDLG